MAPKKKADEPTEEPTVEVAEPKAEKKAKGFVVLDSNGKVIRTVDTAEEAASLVKIYSGRVK